MRRLVINADDFGLTSGINRGIAEAHERGVVTSATLMANGPQFEDAAQLAPRLPQLAVGCHIVMLDGAPILNPQLVPSLLGPDKKELRSSWGTFARAAMMNELQADEIEAEAGAQIRKLQQAGISVSHVDSHKHAHLFPKVLRPILRAAKACSVRAIRNPFEPVKLAQAATSASVARRWLAAAMVRIFAADFAKIMREEGMLTPDGCLGIVATGAWNEKDLAWLIEHMPEGTWELVCHPGYVDDQLRNVRTRLRESRTTELRLLTSPVTRQMLADQEIQLISFRGFAAASA